MLAALAALTALTGCASAERPAVERVVSRFYTAYTDGDGMAACALLSSQTRSSLQQSAGKPCSVGLLDRHLLGRAHVTGSQVRGDQAQVRVSGDTVFVARFAHGWAVVAAGCTSRPERPYDCQVEAG